MFKMNVFLDYDELFICEAKIQFHLLFNSHHKFLTAGH